MVFVERAGKGEGGRDEHYPFFCLFVRLFLLRAFSFSLVSKPKAVLAQRTPLPSFSPPFLFFSSFESSSPPLSLTMSSTRIYSSFLTVLTLAVLFLSLRRLIWLPVCFVSTSAAFPFLTPPSLSKRHGADNVLMPRLSTVNKSAVGDGIAAGVRVKGLAALM